MESTEMVQEVSDGRVYADAQGRDVVLETLDELSANEPFVQLPEDVGERVDEDVTQAQDNAQDANDKGAVA